MPSPRYYSIKAGLDMNEDFVRETNFIDQYVSNQLWSWGHNYSGTLGDNSVTHRSSPVQAALGGTSWKQAAAGKIHSAAVRIDGTLWTWGHNTNGQLGINAITHRSSPVQTVSTTTNWNFVACGAYHTLGIKTDGTMWSWGRNTNGQLGENTGVVHRSSPVQVVGTGSAWVLASGGVYFSAGVKADGTLWTWGRNNNGQLGLNDIVHRSSPAQVSSGSTDWKTASCGQFSMSAVKTDGTLWSWGYNANGQFGDNTQVDKSTPVQTISAGTNWKDVSVGYYHVVALKTDGTLWSWGRGIEGQLADNSIASRSSPVQELTGSTAWKLIATGSYHTLAVKTDGTLWVWGANGSGQLGDNTRTHRSSPIQTATSSTWKNIANGHSLWTLAIKYIEN